MARRTFVTSMPDQAGAFMQASRVIAEYGGNIVRVSYNKAVDPHMLFLDVEAEEETLAEIQTGLLHIGYLKEKIAETRVIEVSIKIPDRPGALLPVLEILFRHEINISYLNSSASGVPYQAFKLGLLIEKPGIIKTLLDEISGLYPIDIIECESSEDSLDNTVFYIRLAGEMRQLLGLDDGQSMQFIAESNRILQSLQAGGENAGKVFDYIRRFAYFVSGCRGEGFSLDIERLPLSGGVNLYSLQPLCGSNTYVFDTGSEFVLLDTGYAIFAPEMKATFQRLFPDFENRPKRVYITHADVDHCGLLSFFDTAHILVNHKSAQSLSRQAEGLPDYRECTELNFGYSKISRIISGYVPPRMDRLEVFDSDTPDEHRDLIGIGSMSIGPLPFTIFEGSGGHLSGEMVYACEAAGLLFTGDILVNISGFSKERSEFNSLAPYLMRSVNIDSEKASQMRRQVTALGEQISKRNGKPCIVCGGHGPLSILKEGRLTRMPKE